MVDQAAEFYNNIFRSNSKKWSAIANRDVFVFRALSEMISEPASMLDYGCGNGHTIAYFKGRWPNTRYTGVDISDVALEIAKTCVPEAEFYRELPDGTWNVITIMGVAEHFADPGLELKRLGEHLSGLMYLEIPNCLSYSRNKEEGIRKTHAGSGQKEWHWQRETWERVIDYTGLEIVKRFSGFSPAWEFIWVLRGN